MSSAIELLSIWLIPDEPELTDLKKRIAVIAQNTGSPNFIPHITLLGDLPVSTDVLEAAVTPYTAKLVRLELEVTGVSTGEEFHKSLFLDLNCPPLLAEVQRALQSALPEAKFRRPFQPHVSMSYGHISGEQKTKFQNQLMELTGLKLQINSVSLVLSNQNLAVENWRILRNLNQVRR